MEDKCCANCIYLDKSQMTNAQIGTHYIYGCRVYGIDGVCIKDWVNNDAELENIVCEAFKPKE